MKKNITFIVAVLCSVLVFSQEKGNKEYSKEALYGVRAGYNISNLDYDPDATFSNKHRNGFAFAFVAQYPLSGTFAFSPEVQFSAEGAKSRDKKINYIQAPLIFKLKIAENLSLGVGPMVGIKLHQDEVKDYYKDLAFSGVGVLEYMITEDIFIDARYHYGLTNIIESGNSFEAKNTCIQLGVGFRL
ncbi:MAG: porin family protein [Flavobacteriaceae bacterium]